jgi:hypothetical protein
VASGYRPTASRKHSRRITLPGLVARSRLGRLPMLLPAARQLVGHEIEAPCLGPGAAPGSSRAPEVLKLLEAEQRVSVDLVQGGAEFAGCILVQASLETIERQLKKARAMVQ